LTGAETALTGAIAGGTIFLGLPVARIRAVGRRGRAFLGALSVGVLAFLFTDVIGSAGGHVERAIEADRNGRVVLLGALLILGLGVGPIALARAARPRPGDAVLRLGLLVAVAIGVHNLAEGLAIGVAARQGEVALAGTLVTGFALHNATEGFGIIGPLGDHRPSWRWLGLAGLIAGGPTFIGSVVGYRMTVEPLQVAALGLAAGAIAYVIVEIGGSVLRRCSHQLAMVGALIGFSGGLVTDWILVAAGG
jgi:ZIP family zinc transporter